MRIHFGVVVTLFALSFTASGQQKNQPAYQYTVDLTRVVNDRVYVELTPPPVDRDEVTFYLPKIVPGTYSIADYGRYVIEFTASDKKGKKLEVQKLEENAWRIKGAKKLAKISYYVDDTWDTTVSGPEIFWPAGTNIEEGVNYVINTSGFFGYFDGQKEVPFQFNVVRPKELYGTTGLIPTQSGVTPASLKLELGGRSKDKVVDVFQASDYDQLIDSPLMYSKPDTAVIRVGNAEVLIGSYSPNKKVTAKEIAGSIWEVLMAQKEFLGGDLPVDKYAFIFYFTDQPIESYGALEHSYSSMYYMPEMTIADLQQQVRDFAAHEFFHIVTPLTVHSKEIADFDFNNPKMSKHLWMYEGVTEYFAGLVQVQYGLIGIDEYIGTLQEKMHTADQFINDVPFTDISKFTLDKYQDQYYNVYQKGTLIGLCADLTLLKLSEGKYNLRDLMLDLSKKYGKNKAFNDEELFDEITRMTYPTVGEFFKKHVAGTEPLPLRELFRDVGIIYTESDTVEDFSLGLAEKNIAIGMYEGKQKLMIANAEELNEMGKALGFQDGDLLIKINGDSIPDLGDQFPAFIQRQLLALPEAKTLSYSVIRKDEAGVDKPVELSAAVEKIKIVRRHFMAPADDATPEQIALRDAWLRP